MLRDPHQRRKAMDVVEFIAGSFEEMEPETLQTLQLLHETLELKPIALLEAIADPLTESATEREVA